MWCCQVKQARADLIDALVCKYLCLMWVRCIVLLARWALMLEHVQWHERLEVVAGTGRSGFVDAVGASHIILYTALDSATCLLVIT